jgi:hypothetical protein
VSSLDTDPSALAVQRGVLARLGPDARTELAVRMSEELRVVTLEGLAERHPEAAHAELVLLLIERWHGSGVRADICAARPPRS